MKATGIVRRIDDLGRVVIPKEIRRTLRIRDGDPSGDKKNPENPRRRPVADDIGTVAEILLRHVGFGQKNGMGVVHIDGKG